MEVSSVASKNGLVFRRRVPKTKTWWDLSPKLQREVFSFLDYHTLLQCRLVSRDFKCQADKVVELQKRDPGLLWNPYFNEPKEFPRVDSKLLLGLVLFQSAAEVKQFIEQYDTSESEGLHKTPPPSVVTTRTQLKVAPSDPLPHPVNKPIHNHSSLPPSRKPSEPVPVPPPTKTTSEAVSLKKQARHQSCVLEQCPMKSSTATAKAAPSASKTTPIMKSNSTAKATPSKSQSQTRPKTAPSSLVSTHPPTPPVNATSPPTKPVPQSTVKPPTPVPAVKPATSAVLAKKVPKSSQTMNTLPPMPPKLFGSSCPSLLFPLGAVYIRRFLPFSDGDYQSSKGTADSTKVILHWSFRLIQNYGKQLTSFSFDDGIGELSNLTFEQLRSILRQLPSLVFLGITAGNYEHHVDIEEMLENEEEVEKLPVLEHLRFVSVGYNVSYHLHMDILTAYGCQLRRFVCSKFGHFVRSPFGYYVSTNNSFYKLLEYAKAVRCLYPNMLSSLEELKVPILSSQCLIREVELPSTGPFPLPWIHWSNLKRLSLFYIFRGDGYSDCCLADVWSMLNSFSSTLEELCLDFQACSDFIQWISSDARPFPSSVFEPCPKLRKLCISAVALLRSEDMAGIISSKCPNLEILTFFKWSLYYREAIEDNNRQGLYYSGGPTPITIPGHMGFFWNELESIQKMSIRVETWNDDCIYQKYREGMSFVPRKEATYIF